MPTRRPNLRSFFDLARALGLLGAALLGAPAASQNLVANGNFDANTASWTPSGPITITWSSADAFGGGASGSGLVTHNGAANTVFAVEQCVSGLTPGATYDSGGRIRYPSGQAGAGTARVAVTFFGSAGCTGTLLGDLYVPVVPPPSDAWTLRTNSGVAPAGAVSAIVRLYMVKGATAPAFSASFDAIRFGIAPTTPVALLGFDVE